MDRASKRHRGRRSPSGCEVIVDDPTDGPMALSLRLELRNHSPTGFEWGYSGSGPAQLSLALLTDALGDAEKAQEFYQDFKLAVVARLAADQWEMSQDEIRQSVAALESKRGRSR